MISCNIKMLSWTIPPGTHVAQLDYAGGNPPRRLPAFRMADTEEVLSKQKKKVDGI
jgi:hypothetical protein